MTNFIFKSGNADLQKISQLIQLLLSEQKHQRIDLASIKSQLHKVINTLELENQVKSYYQEQAQKINDSDVETANENKSESVPDW